MRKNFYLGVIVFCSIIISLSSCVNQKQMVYFQKGLNQSDTINVIQAYVPKIQPGDIIEVDVGSLNPFASSFFNPYSTVPVTTDITQSGNATVGGIGTGGASAATPQNVPSYLVDSAGTIEFPLVGVVKVGGLTTSQARGVIKSKVSEYLKGATVNVRFLNYKISVIGEVNRPSVYVIANERVTLPEAIGLAGDLTIYGKRTNVLIVRDLNNGKKEFGHVDLTSRELYTSPYYYLRSNDVVYVEPTKVRIQQSDSLFKILPLIISVISLIVISIYYGKHS